MGILCQTSSVVTFCAPWFVLSKLSFYYPLRDSVHEYTCGALSALTGSALIPLNQVRSFTLSFLDSLGWVGMVKSVSETFFAEGNSLPLKAALIFGISLIVVGYIWLMPAPRAREI